MFCIKTTVKQDMCHQWCSRPDPRSRPVALIILKRRLFCAIFWKVGTNVRTQTCAKAMITTGRDCGAAEWINMDLYTRIPSLLVWKSGQSEILERNCRNKIQTKSMLHFISVLYSECNLIPYFSLTIAGICFSYTYKTCQTFVSVKT